MFSKESALWGSHKIISIEIFGLTYFSIKYNFEKKLHVILWKKNMTTLKKVYSSEKYQELCIRKKKWLKTRQTMVKFDLSNLG